MERTRRYSSVDVSSSLLWTPVRKEAFQLSRDETDARQQQDNESLPLVADGDLRQSSEGVSWVMTAFLIVNTALGIGLLNFPASYDEAGGVLFATVIQMVVLVLMVATMMILCYCSDFHGDKTYHDVLLTMCGRRAQRIAAVSVTCTLYCVSIAVLIIIGDQMDSLFLSLFGSTFCHTWYLERHFTISAVAILLILPMCFCKRVDFLRFIGPVGIFAMLYPVFLTVYGYLTTTERPTDIKTRPNDWAAMFAVIPVLGLGYQCQEVIVPIYSCMKRRNLCDFTKASTLAMAILFIIYSVTGCFGYLTFGADVAHNIMKMFNADDPIVMIGVGALIIKMIVTYPIMAVCGRDAVIGLYAEFSGISSKKLEYYEKTCRFVVAIIWFGSTLMFGLLTAGLGIVIQYIGCVASANIYVYPGYGESPSAAISDKADFLQQLLKALNLKKAVIVSPSMSGFFTLPFIVKYPNALSGFVPVAPVGIEVLEALPAVSGDADQIQVFKPLEKFYTKPVPNLSFISTPTMVVYGEKDRSRSSALLSLLPNSQCQEIPNGSHPAYLDDPDLWHKLLYNFLKNIEEQS